MLRIELPRHKPTATDMSGKPLDARQLQAARLIASGHTQKQAAEKVGVTTRTIERWNQLEAFKRAVDSLTGTIPITKPSQGNSFEPEALDFNELPWSRLLQQIPDRCFAPVETPDKKVFYKFTESASGQYLERLLPLVFFRLQLILENPDARVADQLAAAKLIGDWSGFQGGLKGSLTRVFAAGYTIYDENPPEFDEHD